MLSITIQEALRLGRESSTGCPEHLQNLEYLGHLVEDFASQHWDAQQFSDVKIAHVKQLIADMERQGRSVNYIRHAVNAIRLASNYMVDSYGALPIKIEQRHLPERHEQPKIWLTYRQISKACIVSMDTDLRKRVDSTKSQPRPMELARVIVMTCGLCGLRLTEFGRLTPDCLDAAGNLSITGDTKNESSKRVIPLPAVVADAMRKYWARHGLWSRDRTSNAARVRALFRATADATDDDLYWICPPKNLRKSFVNELEESCPEKYLIAYGGWAFRGVLMRNYMSLRPRPDDHPTIRDAALAKLRAGVTAEIEKKMQGMHF